MRRKVYFEPNVEHFTATFDEVLPIQGQSAYEIAVNKGLFVGTEEEWIASLHGKDATTFFPQISKDKILSWTNDGNLPNPTPVDLNPFDDWVEDGESEYEWEDET